MMAKTAHNHTLRRTIRVRASRNTAWRLLADIAGMPAWAHNVRKTAILSEKKRGVGAVRLVTFSDGRKVEEHITSWKPKSCFTYAATDGLPLRAYVATISIAESGGGSVRITWQSYMSSAYMTESQFGMFLADLAAFYEISLGNLRRLLEGTKT